MVKFNYQLIVSFLSHPLPLCLCPALSVFLSLSLSPTPLSLTPPLPPCSASSLSRPIFFSQSLTHPLTFFHTLTHSAAHSLCSQRTVFLLFVCFFVQEILSVFAELKPLLKKSKSRLAANLVGGGQNPVAAGGPEGVNAAEQQDTNILSRIQRLYNLTAEAKVSTLRGLCMYNTTQLLPETLRVSTLLRNKTPTFSLSHSAVLQSHWRGQS